jgi:tRNA (guanine37-N1)-methyltransferase
LRFTVRFNVITIFPEYFAPLIERGVVGQAIKKSILTIHTVNPRDFTSDRHRTVDDRPFGGGDGMLLLYEPLARAVESIPLPDRGPVLYVTPQGKPMGQADVLRWAGLPGLTIVCGRYGGVDERFVGRWVDEEVSLGDFVLSGGEIAAMAIIDSVSRQQPGTLGHAESATNESFADTGPGGAPLLEAPLFSRPQSLDDWVVPQVFIEGHHKKISESRRAISVVRTAVRRPDLFHNAKSAEFALREELAKAKSDVLRFTDQELRSLGLERSQIENI